MESLTYKLEQFEGPLDLLLSLISKNKVNIPKNVRQIGTDDGKFRVYIEDYAYSFVKDISV